MGRLATSKPNSKPEKIKFCKESTITEAWCVIRGANYPYTTEFEPESDAVVTTARKHTKDLVVDPSLIIMNSRPREQTRPFWIRQCSWEDKKRLARTGYSYLSIHRVCNPEANDKYDRYNHEILPFLRSWLTHYQSGSLHSEKQYLANVAFGYRNRFIFDFKDSFDPTEYFNVLMGTDFGQSDNNLVMAGAESSFRFTNTKTKSQLNFAIKLADRPGTNKMVVETHCTSELFSFEKTNFSQSAKILSIVRDAQTEAKELFFSITTKKTLEEILKAESEK